MKYDIDQILREIDCTDIDTPIFDFYILGINFSLWKTPELSVTLCETSPYAPDGEVPLIFIRLAYLEIMFYNKPLYNYIYKKKYGWEIL